MIIELPVETIKTNISKFLIDNFLACYIMPITRKRLEPGLRLLDYANQSRLHGFFNDVVIKAGERYIKANRLILSCYSEYFQEKFKAKFDGIDAVVIDNEDGKSVEVIIDYMYTGGIVISEQNVLDLLSVSQLLKMNDVKAFCLEFMESTMNPSNCILGINVAVQYKNESMLAKFVQYLSDHFQEISHQVEFNKMSAVELISCISNIDREKVKEIVLYQAIVSWTKYDHENRQKHFPDLFQMLQLNKLSYEDLIFIVSKEKIIKDSNPCLNSILTTLPKVLKIKELKGTASRILSIGGFKTPRKVSQIFSLLDEPSNQFPDLPIDIKNNCSLKLDNCVYSIGGQITKNEELIVANDVWLMDLNDRNLKWTKVSPMIKDRWQFAAAVYKNTLVVCNGDDGSNITETNEIYNKATNEWEIISSLQNPRNSHALAACEGFLLAIGGWFNNQVLSSVERLNDLNSTWAIHVPLQTPRQYLAAVYCKGYVYAIGGESGVEGSTRLKSVEKYSPDINTWVYVSCMKFERASHSACVLEDKIFVVGGLNSDGKVVKEIECYDPSTDSWSVIDSIMKALYLHSLVVV